MSHLLLSQNLRHFYFPVTADVIYKVLKEKFMKNAFIVILFVISMIFQGPALSEDITPELINVMLNESDTAIKNKDTAAFAKFISDSASIVIEVPTPNGTIKITPSKQQYIQMLEQGWSSIPGEYKYERKTPKITVSDNGTVGTSLSIVNESYIIDGKTISSSSQEKAKYAFENKSLVIISIEATAQINSGDI